MNAWVVVKPDDSVVIRVARSEMGQGTLTGLCQLVAEELECDWSKVSYEFPTPGENLARKRVWSDFFTAGSRGIRASHETVRKGGAAARMMLIQAAANEWKVPASECSAANSVITHKASGRSTTFGKVANAASKIEPPADVKLKDPKDWKIAGKGVKRLDTAIKVNGEAIYGIDIKLPGMVNAAIKACPVFGGKVKSFDAAKVASMKRREEGGRGRATMPSPSSPTPGGTPRPPGSAADRVGRRRQRQGLQRHHRRRAQGRARCRPGHCRQPERRHQSGAGRRGQEGRGRLRLSLPAPRHPGAEERHRALYAGQVRSVVLGAGRRAGAGGDRGSVRRPVGKCEFYKTFLGGGFGRRSTSVDYVRQAVLVAKEMPGTPVKLLVVARRGHDPRLVSSRSPNAR